MADLQPACERFRKAATAAGIDVDIVTFTESSRTAEEAAARCGCTVAQIIKSLIFREVGSGNPLLLLVSGANRVNEKEVAKRIGERFERPDAAFVRTVTGYAIGGIPPLGHAQQLPTFMDEALLDFTTIWAAAGTPNAVFSAIPDQLVEVTGAKVIAMT